MYSGATLQALQTAADALSYVDDREVARAFQAAQDALDTAKAARLSSMELSRSYELDGAASLNVWVRNELRMSAKQATTLVRMPHTIARLPAVARAAEAGEIRAEHVAAFTYGIKHVGADVVDEHEAVLVDVAKTAEPHELFKVIRHLREVIYPDDLDKAWAEGMEREDIQINAVPDGFHINGFLGPVTGAKAKAVFDAVSKPTGPDDLRTGAQRRVDGFDALMTSILESGLPSDKGVRPQLSVILDTTGDTPAQLAGFGSIGPKLLDYLTCSVDLTPIYTRNGQILDVGRSHRLATVRQRRAVLARQGNECAAPGCHNTHLEIHHITWWSRRGKTDLDNLIGLCTRCHHLVHRDLLVINPDHQLGLNFTNNHGRPVARQFTQRVTNHQIARQNPRPYAPMRT
jgi:hypothetical protein